jgi:diguanylate cyclase (GGDEF)-like protein
MDTVTKPALSRRAAWASPTRGLPAARLQSLLKLSHSLLDAESETDSMAALGSYLSSELNVSEAVLLFSSPPDLLFKFNGNGTATTTDDGHALMATARASLRGVTMRVGCNISVARLVVDSSLASLVVRWNRHGAQRMLAEQEALLAHAAELTVKSVCKLRTRADDRALHDSEHACELARRDRLEEQMRVESTTDTMTGLSNRRGFFMEAEHAFMAARRRGANSAVIFADIDNLKSVNDRFGHKTGDALICDAATIFKSSLRSADIVARLGGDEFVAYTLDDERPESLLRRIDQNIATFNAVTCRPYLVSFSTGIVGCDAHASLGLADYLIIADRKMYERKQRRMH